MNGWWFLYADKATYWCRFAAQKEHFSSDLKTKKISQSFVLIILEKNEHRVETRIFKH